MGFESIKIGDLVYCGYDYHGSYGKVIKLFDRNKNIEVEEYGPVITGVGFKNSKLDITVQVLAHSLNREDSLYDLGDLVEINEIEILDPNEIYSIITEKDINEMRISWETLMKNKLDFLYKNVNKPPMSGRKTINSLKF